jgi:hypothetical protein
MAMLVAYSVKQIWLSSGMGTVVVLMAKRPFSFHTTKNDGAIKITLDRTSQAL